MRSVLIIFSILCLQGIKAQVQKEINPPENIKSIVFNSNNKEYQFPIIQQGDKFHLSFDDLYADEKDYYYQVSYYNHDWTLSRLLKSQYLRGVDNQRITTYSNSLATLQPYTHYSLTLPNKHTRFKITGNYVLTITDNLGNPIFSRRFVIYKNLVGVNIDIKTAREVENVKHTQRIQFTINSPDFDLVNPQKEVKVVLMQNSNFNTIISEIKPQFTSGSQLIYKYDKETSFEGGNEYLWFDTKEIRVANNHVAKVDLKNRYNHYLFRDQMRADKPYTYNPDINGDFYIRTVDGGSEDSNREADYSFVRFSLPYTNEIGLDKIYVYGKFNNYQFTKENLLKLDIETKTLNTPILLKQGFYNYKYVKVSDKGVVDLNFVGGSFWQTENSYTILVYYREFGKMYDSVIGIGTTNSERISN